MLFLGFQILIAFGKRLRERERAGTENDFRYSPVCTKIAVCQWKYVCKHSRQKFYWKAFRCCLFVGIAIILISLLKYCRFCQVLSSHDYRGLLQKFGISKTWTMFFNIKFRVCSITHQTSINCLDLITMLFTHFFMPKAIDSQIDV